VQKPERREGDPGKRKSGEQSPLFALAGRVADGSRHVTAEGKCSAKRARLQIGMAVLAHHSVRWIPADGK